ncbi:M4 family metallopeptidase [Zobellia galactanivorans]|uniref:Extracellular metallopeptidase, family M4 n=1 Tax=Zobellia galactanivorans (strain DSM 12802 / CCUG 47099 / CIP 106680 / NCIMB 13871 / Dsij) TaxID=63186 RepID=G0L2C4_ZOBGA|nr:M4 family metallopeptidase [Zobellia galactanivorans]CAZ98044.1 Extracellular metallopeptidase, family M4 [Zobellia galactanivorans]
MKNRPYLLTFVLVVLAASSLRAQDTFDDKRHDKGTTAKTGSIKKFNALKLAAKKKGQSLPGRTNFQMPSVFQITSGDAVYEHEVIGRSEDGIPLFIKSKAGKEVASLTAKQSSEQVIKDYLAGVKHLIQVKDPDAEFVEISKHTDALGQKHIKMQQVFKGIKVYGGELILHLDQGNKVDAMNGRNKPTPSIERTQPKLSVQDALQRVEKDLGVSFPTKTGKTNSVFLNSDYEEELLIYPFEGKNVLARHLTVHPNIKDRWEYFIDAQNGRILNKIYHTCTLYHEYGKEGHERGRLAPPPSNTSGTDLNGVTRQLDTYSIDGKNYMINTSKSMFNSGQSKIPDNPVGAIMTWDLKNKAPEEDATFYYVTSTTSTWNDPVAVSAQYNAEVSYDYFEKNFDRSSINGQGGTIISIVNVAADDGGGYDNAFWNGKAIFYGNGKAAFSPLAGALDVGGHEMSHGVIEATANLEYSYQSGAINESFADIFGTMIDRDDWLLGEDIVNREYFNSGAMRNLQDPNNGASQGQRGWQPKDMTEYYSGEEDNGGVHMNSGIVNRAYYLIATDIGKDKAEQIYYRALSTYLTASSQFIDLRIAVVQSALDLHGENSAEVAAIETAFDTVGITAGTSTDTDNDIPLAEGDEFILSLDIRDTDPNTIYASDTEATIYYPLTTTGVHRKPSVSDDGSFAIFVTEENKVNAISLDVNAPEESVISEDPVWAAVSLSKDGTKLASVINDESNIIYVSDLVTGEFKEFELYNPTSADGVTTGEVLYPDALEWDYSGQYLIYDALNRLNNADGTNIEYWDVGALQVWDNQTNTFGDGSIQKIFTNLPEGVSIGNPSFSKTSGNILAFDYFNELEGEYSIITVNIETGDVKKVYDNNKLGFPNFSKTDDKIIFDTYNGSDQDIMAIGLAADKMTPTGSAEELIPNGKWGIWYTVGSRSTLSSEKEITDFRFNVTSPPTVGSINGNEIVMALPANINPGNLVATFATSARATVSVSGLPQQSGVSFNDFTEPVVYTVTAEDGSTKDFTVRLMANDPNDTDNDGVPNADDLCPNTPLGATVDLTGCEIFSLPSTNFTVSAKGESCMDSHNGSIDISANSNHSYTVTLAGNGVSETQSFTSSVSFSNLKSGSYSVCITVAGQADYERCFEVNVSEPEALSVSSKVNLSARSVSLNLSGAEEYIISLDNETVVTQEAQITLPLRSSTAKLSVKTNKSCQGTYSEDLMLHEEVIVYPNPVESGAISVVLGKTYGYTIPVQLNSFDGRIIFQKAIAPQTNTITLDAESLTAGVYVLSVQINDETKTYKIIKQ